MIPRNNGRTELNQLIEWFCSTIDGDFVPDAKLQIAIERFQESVLHQVDEENFLASLSEAGANKLACNKRSERLIFDGAFRLGVSLDYHDKLRVVDALNACDMDGYIEAIKKKAPTMLESFAAFFQPLSRDEVFSELRGIKQTDNRYQLVYESVLARAVFNLASREDAWTYFGKGEKATAESYFDYVEALAPGMVRRDCGLAIVDTGIVDNGDYPASISRTCGAIKKAYDTLANNADLAVLIPRQDDDGVMWRLFSDVILFAEKFVLDKNTHMYFRRKNIARATAQYINELNVGDAEFDFEATGFVFKDCFVFYEADPCAYSLLLILEKNVRDERPVPCPACRGLDIEGNSYPILNVRSWACDNPLCPDKSKYNRGKRYHFSSLLRRDHIQVPEDAISQNILTKWHLDCLSGTTVEDALEMAIRCYSFHDDSIAVWSGRDVNPVGRKMDVYDLNSEEAIDFKAFKDSAWFRRYDLNRKVISSSDSKCVQIGNARLVHGEAEGYLSSLPDGCFAAAVTSPPYYNAREYSQWENMYCYLYDMRNVARQVYRTLKDGGVFLYNVFDYFDNERTVAFSAMGNKRMTLGAYAIKSFEDVGFKLCANVIWYKGEIQGNRNFNQGNCTPYYQAPLNCWEHMLVFSKGEPAQKFSGICNDVRRIHPVVKMVRGKNTYGHTAPFPTEVPDVVVDCLERGDIVLDPFGGSATTAVSAERHGVSSVCIELNERYFELAQQKVREARSRLSLL